MDWGKTIEQPRGKKTARQRRFYAQMCAHERCSCSCIRRNMLYLLNRSDKILGLFEYSVKYICKKKWLFCSTDSNRQRKKNKINFKLIKSFLFTNAIELTINYFHFQCKRKINISFALSRLFACFYVLYIEFFFICCFFAVFTALNERPKSA